MQIFTYYETTRFRVKNAEQFQKDYRLNLTGEESDLDIAQDGFVLTGVNLACKYPELELTWEDSVAQFLHENVREGEGVEMSCLSMSDLNDSHVTYHYFITSLGWNKVSSEGIFARLKAELFPRKVKCNISAGGQRHKDSNTWIEAGQEYIATEETRIGNRLYYGIRHGTGEVLTWGKEYFDDTTQQH